MAKLCDLCHNEDGRREKAIIRRPKTGQIICKSCFFLVFEEEIHRTIIDNKLFSKGDKVAIAVSGGKGKTDFKGRSSVGLSQ